MPNRRLASLRTVGQSIAALIACDFEPGVARGVIFRVRGMIPYLLKTRGKMQVNPFGVDAKSGFLNRT